MDVLLEVRANIEALHAFAHERLQAIAAAYPNVRTELGTYATPAADRGLVRAQSVNCRLGRWLQAMPEHGLESLEHVVAFGPNTVSSKRL